MRRGSSWSWGRSWGRRFAVASVTLAVGCTVLLDPPSGILAGPCQRDADCALRQVCAGGSCRESCSADSACGKGETCQGGACLAAPEPPDATTAVARSPCGDLTTDPANCGACGHVCAGGHWAFRCAASQCVPDGCAPGWADCDREAANGCEVDLNDDPANCRYCGGTCDDTPWNLCQGGNCLRVSDYAIPNQNWDRERFAGGNLWIAVKIHIDLGGTVTGIGFVTVANGSTQATSAALDGGTGAGAIGQWGLYTDDDGPQKWVATTAPGHAVTVGPNEIAMQVPAAVAVGTYWVVGYWNDVSVDFKAADAPQVPDGSAASPNWVIASPKDESGLLTDDFPTEGTYYVDWQPWVYAIVAH